MSGAERPKPPRVNTNAHGRNTGSARQYSNSPSNPQYAGANSSTRDGMTPRKRGTESRSRGNSPPDKRSRVDNPAPSRQNSASTDKRRADVNAGGSKSGDVRRPSMPYSASHVQSPGGTSGGSTPTHGAPTVPNMLARPPPGVSAAMPITLASLRSVKQKKEAISKAAALQSGKAKMPTPQHEKPDDNLSAQLKALEGLPAQIASMKLQMDQAPDYPGTLADFERRFIKLENNKGISIKIEQLEKATNSHTAELATLAGLKASIEELMQSKSAVKDDISNSNAQLQQNKSEVQKLTEDIRFLSRGFEILDNFRKEQEKLNISPRLDSLTRDIAEQKREKAKPSLASRVEKLSREIEDLKTEQDKLNIAPRLKKLTDDIEDVRVNEKKTYNETRDNTTAIRKYVGLVPEEYVDFEEYTMVERLDRHTAVLKDLEKSQRERPKLPANQKASATPEDFEKLRSEQSALSRKQGELMTTLARLERLQGEQEKRMEKQEKLGPTVGQIQKLQTVQAELSTEHGKLSTKQDTQQSRIKVLEDNSMAATSQLDAAHKAEMKGLNDNVQASAASVNQLERQLSRLGDQFSSLHVDQINDDVKALVPRLAHLEQQSKKNDDHATALLVKEVNDGLQALIPRIAQLEEQTSLEDELSSKIANLTTQIDQVEQKVQGFENQQTRPGLLPSQSIVPSQATDHTDIGAVSKLRTQTASLEASIQSLNNRLLGVQADVKSLSDEADEDRQSIGDRLNDLFDTAINPAIKELQQEVNMLQQQRSPPLPTVDFTPLEEATKTIKQDLARLHTMRANDAALRQQEIADIQSQLAAKPSIPYVDESLNNLRAVFRALQDQYNNISTDDLYSKMVHWFLDNNPSNPAQVLQQLAVLQHELRSLQNLSRETTWLQTKIQELGSLLKMAPRLSALVREADRILHLLENGAQFDSAGKDADQARSKADKIEALLVTDGVDVQSLPIAIRDMQQTLRGIESNSTSFVTRQDITHIKQDIGNEIKTHYTSISNKDRLDVETSVTKLNDRIQSLEDAASAKPAGLHEQLNQVMTDVKSLKEAEIVLSSLLKAVAELQSIVSKMHQNWPPDAESFECTIEFDFNRVRPAQQQANPKTAGANKGKARQL